MEERFQRKMLENVMGFREAEAVSLTHFTFINEVLGVTRMRGNCCFEALVAAGCPCQCVYKRGFNL